MSRCKLTDYFKPVNNKNVRQDVDSTVQNQPVTETTILQGKEAVTIEENKPLTLQLTFAFLKENLEKDNILARPIGCSSSNDCIMMSSKWI